MTVLWLMVAVCVCVQPWGGEEVLHAVAGVCSVCLPDMEVPAIYNTLTTSTTILVLTDPSGTPHCMHAYSRRLPTTMLYQCSYLTPLH